MSKKDQKESFSMIGAGRVGMTLGLLWNEAGYRPLDVIDTLPGQAARAVALIGAGRPSEGPLSASGAGDFILLSVPDREIVPAASLLSRSEVSWEGRVVFHCSGAQTASILSPLSRKGASTGSLHPIQSFSEPKYTAGRIQNTWFGVEGGDRFRTLAERLIHDIGGRILIVPGDRKVPYHAAAVMASNYLTVLIDQAAGVMSEVGIEKEEAVKALLPLVEGTISGIREQGPVNALTGPIERGDAGTVRAHLAFLRCLDPIKNELYRLLGRAALTLASEKGSPALEKIKAILSGKREGDT